MVCDVTMLIQMFVGRPRNGKENSCYCYNRFRYSFSPPSFSQQSFGCFVKNLLKLLLRVSWFPTRQEVNKIKTLTPKKQ